MVFRDHPVTVVSFDVGETLLRPYPSFASAFARLCSECGVFLSESQASVIEPTLAARQASYERAGLTYSDTIESSRRFWESLYRDVLAELGVDASRTSDLPGTLYDGFTRSSTYRPFDDAEDTVRALRNRGYRIGILSNWEPWLTRLLSDIGWTDLFDFTVISGEVGCEKPDPRIYRIAIEAAGVAADSILHVGDNPVADVRGSIASGFRAVLIDRQARHIGHEGLRIERLSDLLLGSHPAGALLNNRKS